MQRSKVTIIDVARVAGVSKSTVANVLSANSQVPIHATTRQRVLEAAARLGYRKNALAAAFSSGRTHTVGVLLPLHHMQATSRVYRIYGQDIFMAIVNAACRAGLRVASIPNLERDPTIADLTDRRVDGLILASLRNPDLVQAIYDSGIPCVEIGSGYGNHLVHPDNEGGAAQAVTHLVELGHQRIAHFRGALGGYYVADRRNAGFLAAVREHELNGSDCPVVHNLSELREALELPEGKRPTAVFAFNDNQANEVLELARNRGLRVPGNLSVIGFDNNVVAELALPPLTTIDNVLELQADYAIALLQTLMQKGDTTETESDPSEVITPRSVPTRLVVRQSTAAPEGA